MALLKVLSRERTKLSNHAEHLINCIHLSRRYKCFEANERFVLPTQAQVIICGAGAVANSVAYHLVENGWTDVLLIDKGTLCGGTSHFGSGTLGLFKPIAERNVILYSIKLYRQLQAKGYNIGLKQCGSLNLAQTKDRMIELKRCIAYNLPTGLHCEVVDHVELKRLHPFLYTDDLEGGVWVPEDAVANSQAICKALAKLAMEGGAQYIENCLIQQVLTENGRVKGIQTDRGYVSCEYFVNCAGMWARELGQLSSCKVRVPVYPAEHFYVTTSQLPGVTANLPYIRDFDSSTYIRELNGGYLIGAFEPEAKPAFVEHRTIPANWKKMLPQDWDHFTPFWEKALTRLPVLKEVTSPILTNSPDTFTPDGRWILGETPEVRNYFVAVGMNGNSLQGAGGIGRAVAEWIIEGEPTQDLLPFNVQRFLDLHNNRQYLQQRTKEVVGRHYAIYYPNQCEYKYARNLRCSPLYSILEKNGAVFGTRMAYERPLYFDTSQTGTNAQKMPPGTFSKPAFFDYMLEEYYACREGAGIIDMSSFSKIRITSQNEGVIEWLQRLCSNDVNTTVGGIVHTGMQNDRGGYENDCILVRDSETSYLMVSPTSQQTRGFQWMRRHLPLDGNIALTDITSMYSVVNVVGPKARQLLSELSQSDIRMQPFTCKLVNIGYASDVAMMAFTHTGEQGFCLYIPSEYAIHVYERIMAVGPDYGVRNVGSITQRFMRIEKFIPLWAEDLTGNTTPFESGSGHLVKLDKDYFIGKFALQRQKDQGVTKRLLLFVLDDLNPETDIWAWGMEPIYRNNQFVGNVTSAGYGFTLGKVVCLGYVSLPGYHSKRNKFEGRDSVVTNSFIMDPSAKYEIDIAGSRVGAEPHICPPRETVLHHQQSTPYIPKVTTRVVPSVNIK